MAAHQKPPKLRQVGGQAKAKGKAKPKKRARRCAELDDMSGMSALDSAESLADAGDSSG
jgi:hypothetical protein